MGGLQCPAYNSVFTSCTFARLAGSFFMQLCAIHRPHPLPFSTLAPCLPFLCVREPDHQPPNVLAILNSHARRFCLLTKVDIMDQQPD